MRLDPFGEFLEAERPAAGRNATFGPARHRRRERAESDERGQPGDERKDERVREDRTLHRSERHPDTEDHDPGQEAVQDIPERGPRRVTVEVTVAYETAIERAFDLGHFLVELLRQILGLRSIAPLEDPVEHDALVLRELIVSST